MSRHRPEYAQWRISVFTRDKWICQICDQVGGKLEAHHIKTVREYPELELDMDNGTTLCKICHKEIHKGPRRSEYPVRRNEAAMFHK